MKSQKLSKEPFLLLLMQFSRYLTKKCGQMLLPDLCETLRWSRIRCGLPFGGRWMHMWQGAIRSAQSWSLISVLIFWSRCQRWSDLKFLWYFGPDADIIVIDCIVNFHVGVPDKCNKANLTMSRLNLPSVSAISFSYLWFIDIAMNWLLRNTFWQTFAPI